MPSAPEFLDRARKIRAVKVIYQIIAKQSAHAAADIHASRKVGIKLYCKAHGAEIEHRVADTAYGKLGGYA